LKLFSKLFGPKFHYAVPRNARLTSKIDIEHNFLFGQYSTMNISPGSILKINNYVEFRKYCAIYLHTNANLIIGDRVFFNNYCSLNCLGKTEIGENTLFGEGVKLYDHNHQYKYLSGDLKVERFDFSIGSIKIGKNCWIGSNVIILNNVEIGDNVIIGANCLIHKNIPPNSIVKLNGSVSIETMTNE